MAYLDTAEQGFNGKLYDYINVIKGILEWKLVQYDLILSHIWKTEKNTIVNVDYGLQCWIYNAKNM